MKKIIIMILVSTFVIVGCTNQNEGFDTYVKVTPSKLFEGDAKKLEPHLDMITGCVKVKYQGDKESIGLKYEIWENGKLKESENAIGQPLSDKRFDGEFSISLREIIGTDLEKSNSMIMKTIISEDKGYIGSTRFIDRFGTDCGYGPVEIDSEINASDDEEVAIWGLTAHKGSYSTSGNNIEDEVKAADWGLVLKLYTK